jgi:hypothetical protein
MTKSAMTAQQSKPNNVASPLSHEDRENLSKHINKFLDIYEKLEPVNHPDVKPNYSYTELLMMAILRSPNYCRPITEVYTYIKENYLFYKHTKKGFWKNAIRHSLSKTKCFTKLGVGRSMKRSEVLNRPVYLWTLVPECLVKFAKGDYRVNLDSNGSNNLKCAFTQVNAEVFWTNVAKTLRQVMDAIKESLTTDVYVKENNPTPKRGPEVLSHVNGNGIPEQSTQPWKRVKLDSNSYTPNGDMSDVNAGKFAYNPAAPYQRYEIRQVAHHYGNTDNNVPHSYGYDFASMIPDIALNYGTAHQYSPSTPPVHGTAHQYSPCTPPVHPAYMHSSPYAYTTLRNHEESTDRKCNVTSPSQCSTSPNSSIDVTGLGNSSFSDSFRSVDNEDRKPYVEVETIDFGGEYNPEPVLKLEMQPSGNEIIEFLAQNGLSGLYHY